MSKRVRYAHIGSVTLEPAWTLRCIVAESFARAQPRRFRDARFLHHKQRGALGLRGLLIGATGVLSVGLEPALNQTRARVCSVRGEGLTPGTTRPRRSPRRDE